MGALLFFVIKRKGFFSQWCRKKSAVLRKVFQASELHQSETFLPRKSKKGFAGGGGGKAEFFKARRAVPLLGEQGPKDLHRVGAQGEETSPL